MAIGSPYALFTGSATGGPTQRPAFFAIVILFGAKLNSRIEHKTARNSTVQPLGARGP